MTNLLVAVSLILSPQQLASQPPPIASGGGGVSSSPVAIGDTQLPGWTDTFKGELWHTNASPVSVVSATPPTTSAPPNLYSVDTSSAEILTAASGAPTTSISEPAAPTRTPIEAGLNRLTELGATPYQLRVFGCLAWFESKNDPYAVSRTNDYGIWQINRYYHAWRWAGRDVFDPIVNAEVAWDIYRESGFRAWTTARFCV